MFTDQPAPRFQAEKRRIVLLPIGSCEQHGPFLPVDTDLRIATLLAKQVTHLLSEDALLLPALPFSCSYEHRGLGTIALDISTVSAFVHNVARSLKSWGSPSLLVLLNWHGGNDLLGALATEITATESLPCTAIPSVAQVGKAWDTSSMTVAKDIHAGAVETAIIRAYWPELVKEPIPSTAHCEPHVSPAKVQPVLQAIGMYAATAQGIWGAPEDADERKGRELIEKLSRDISVQVTRLLELINNN
ncbi:MAG TPA: creatininase family protein [Ktedonobacteraceae bacterium]|nr:creatininase family protein [Ktedonobacteraceae bacterium]